MLPHSGHSLLVLWVMQSVVDLMQCAVSGSWSVNCYIKIHVYRFVCCVDDVIDGWWCYWWVMICFERLNVFFLTMIMYRMSILETSWKKEMCGKRQIIIFKKIYIEYTLSIFWTQSKLNKGYSLHPCFELKIILWINGWKQ